MLLYVNNILYPKTSQESFVQNQRPNINATKAVDCCLEGAPNSLGVSSTLMRAQNILEYYVKQISIC